MKTFTSESKDKVPDKGDLSKEQRVTKNCSFLKSLENFECKWELNITKLSQSEYRTACVSPVSTSLRSTGTPLTQDQAYKVRRIQHKTIRHVSNNEETSNNAIGVVIITFEDKTELYCKGTMVGPDLVITAASNLTSKNRPDMKIEMISFVPRMDDEHAPFSIRASKFHVPEDGKNSNPAFLLLEASVGLYTGYFGIHAAAKDTIKKQDSFYLDQCPVEVIDNETDIVDLIGRGEVHESWDMQDDRSNVDIQATGDQSGAPLYYLEKDAKGIDRFYIVGIHMFGATTDSFYCGGAAWITAQQLESSVKFFKDTKQEMLEEIGKNLPKSKAPLHSEGATIGNDKVGLQANHGPSELKNLNSVTKNLEALILPHKNIHFERAAVVTSNKASIRAEDLKLSYQKNSIKPANTKKQDQKLCLQQNSSSKDVIDGPLTETPNNQTIEDKIEKKLGSCKFSKEERRILKTNPKEFEFERKLCDIKKNVRSKEREEEEKSAEIKNAKDKNKPRTPNPFIENDIPKAEILETITKKGHLERLKISSAGIEDASKCTDTLHNLSDEQNPSMTQDEQQNQFKMPTIANLNKTLVKPDTSTISLTGTNVGQERQLHQFVTSIPVSKVGSLTRKRCKRARICTALPEKSHHEQTSFISKLKQRDRCDEKLSPRVQDNRSHDIQIHKVEKSYIRKKFSMNLVTNIQDSKTEMEPPFADLRNKCDTLERLQLQLQRSENMNTNTNLEMISHGSRSNSNKFPFPQGVITTKSPECKKISPHLQLQRRKHKCFATSYLKIWKKNLNSSHHMIQFIKRDAVRVCIEVSFQQIDYAVTLPRNTGRLPFSDFRDHRPISHFRDPLALSDFTDYCAGRSSGKENRRTFALEVENYLIKIKEFFGLSGAMNQIPHVTFDRPDPSSKQLVMKGISSQTSFVFSKREKLGFLTCRFEFFIFPDQKWSFYHNVATRLFLLETKLKSLIPKKICLNRHKRNYFMCLKEMNTLINLFGQIPGGKKTEKEDSYKSKKGLHFTDSPVILKQNQIKWLIAPFNKEIGPWDSYRRALNEKIPEKLYRENQYPFKSSNPNAVEKLLKKELLGRQQFLTLLLRAFLVKATSQKLAFNIQGVLIDRMGKRLCKYQSSIEEKEKLIDWLITENLVIREGYNERALTYVLVSYFFGLNSIQDALFFNQILLQLGTPGELDYNAGTEEAAQDRSGTNENKNENVFLPNQLGRLALIVRINSIQILIEGHHLIIQDVILQVPLWNFLENVIDRLFDGTLNVYQDAYPSYEKPKKQFNLLQIIPYQSVYSSNDENIFQYIASQDYYPLDIAVDDSLDLEDYDLNYEFLDLDDEDRDVFGGIVYGIQNTRTNVAQIEGSRAGSTERQLYLAAGMQGINLIANGGHNIEGDSNNSPVQAAPFDCYSESMNDNFRVQWDDAAIMQMRQNQCATNSFHNVEEAFGYLIANDPLEQIILVDFINGNQHESTRILQEYQLDQDSPVRIGIYERIQNDHNQKSEALLHVVATSILDEYQLYEGGPLKIEIYESIQNEQDLSEASTLSSGL